MHGLRVEIRRRGKPGREHAGFKKKSTARGAATGERAFGICAAGFSRRLRTVGSWLRRRIRHRGLSDALRLVDQASCCGIGTIGDAHGAGGKGETAIGSAPMPDSARKSFVPRFTARAQRGALDAHSATALASPTQQPGNVQADSPAVHNAITSKFCSQLRDRAAIGSIEIARRADRVRLHGHRDPGRGLRRCDLAARRRAGHGHKFPIRRALAA